MRKWQWTLVISGVSILIIAVSLMVEGSLWGDRTTSIAVLLGLAGLLIVIITFMHAFLSKKTMTTQKALTGMSEFSSYIIRTKEDGSTEVIFGDGKTGARLPTGVEDISASYREGAGEEGKMPNQKKEIKVFADKKQMIEFLGEKAKFYVVEKVSEEPGDLTLVISVWQEEITEFQLPDLLIEPDLGGNDTRVKACKYCETLNESDALYCKKCGKKLS
jgi:hypothetical protein